MAGPLKKQPSYAITSVDHALHIAVMLQLEGEVTVSQIADRLGVARSTAHRLLAMLVYRDFAVQSENRCYRAGPVLELAAHSHSRTSQLRTAALPHLHRLVDVLGESANLIIRTGNTARFIASVESPRALRIGSREGMVFRAHKITGGLLLLAELSDEELQQVFSDSNKSGQPDDDRPDLSQLRRTLGQIRKNGFVVNKDVSERGVTAIGRLIRADDGHALAGVSISMPSVRYDPEKLPAIVATLALAVKAIQADFTKS